MINTANLGFPRIGLHRELKKAQEAFWQHKISFEELQEVGKQIRKSNWLLQAESGIDFIPSNDFSFYDQMLDMTVMLGAVPKRYGLKEREKVDINTYFAMARGNDKTSAMEMSKWFDTNYHYIVPELAASQEFYLGSSKAFDEYEEAKQNGIITRPVIIGPITFLILSKMVDGSDKWNLLPQLIKIYKEILCRFKEIGVEWVQIDEPCLVLDLDEPAKNAYLETYKKFNEEIDLKLMLTTYFEEITNNLNVVKELPAAGLHIDLVRGYNQLKDVCSAISKDMYLSLGIVDGRNIWKNNFAETLEIIEQARKLHNEEKIIIASSCSLLHSPISLQGEEKLDSEIKNWLAFACEKIEEISYLADAVNGNKDEKAFADNLQAMDSKQKSLKIHNKDVQQRLALITDDMKKRKSSFSVRCKKQKELFNLPILPTTTIGSLPQTKEVRNMRAAYKKNEISAEEYKTFIKSKTIEAIKWQEQIGIDVLVHGEFERNDMVEYFGEKLNGFAFTKNGWVQSYGSRCVKPPIIYGDISRDNPMTVEWSVFASQNTEKPVKGMLTGPITILQWSFVRNDQPRESTCKQIALVIRDEVLDLEENGINIIQIDEPAIREGLPLLEKKQKEYLNWAVDSFLLCSSGVQDTTQIHTHMCYSEFNDIIEAIAALDADVISVEASRSKMELLDAFVDFKYPNQIGPGVYDIHSPRVPEKEEVENLINSALKVLTADQLWINPDCGLKTRKWEETQKSLEVIVDATKSIRASLH